MNRFTVVSIALTGVAAFSTAAVAVAEPVDPEAMVRQVYAALNAEDVEAVMALLADDATITVLPASLSTGRSSFEGKDQIRSVIQAVVAQHDRFEIIGPVSVSDNEVRTHDRSSGDQLRRIGIDSVEEAASWVIRDGKIQAGVTTYTPESVAALERARAAAAAPVTPASLPAAQAQVKPAQTSPAGPPALAGDAVIVALGLLGSIVIGGLAWVRFRTVRRA